MIRITIDGRHAEVPQGTTVLQAAESLGIRIPTLCHCEGLTDEGSCRICVVEIRSKRAARIDTACTALCADGDEIELVLTQIGKECHQGCAIRQQVGDCIMPRRGVFCRILKGGIVKPGDSFRIISRPDVLPMQEG